MASNSSVATSETSNDPRQPSRLEKKKNMPLLPYPTASSLTLLHSPYPGSVGQFG